jgi:hypothetical protein
MFPPFVDGETGKNKRGKDGSQGILAFEAEIFRCPGFRPQFSELTARRGRTQSSRTN